MDAAPFFSLTRRWWWLMLIGAVVAVAAFGVASRIRERNAGPQLYRATATLVVSSDNAARTPLEGAAAPASPAVEPRSWDLDRLMATYAEIITSDAVAARAALELGDPAAADEIQRSLSVDTPGYTQVLRVTARATSPEAASRLAGAVVWSANAVREERQLPGTLHLYDQSPATSVPDDRTPALLAVLIVAVAGAACAAALVLAYETASDAVRDARDAEGATGLRVLAAVPVSRSRRALVNASSTEAARVAERYRMLRTAYGIETRDASPRSLLICAPRPGCGATEVAANVALTIAQTGRRVALVDADLRAPALHTALGVSSDVGLAEALGADLELDAPAAPSAPGVAFIAAGTPPQNPAELLDAPRFDALSAQLRERFDLVVFDAPPALDVTDATVIAARCDAAIVVARTDRTNRRDLRACVELLRRSGTRIVGIVLAQEARSMRLPSQAGRTHAPPARAEAEPR
jgi:capsular exopolysaccharide synthesis family protein